MDTTSRPYRAARIFADLWEKKYGRRYDIKGGAKKAAKEFMDLDDDEIVSRVKNYLADDNPYYVERRHNIFTFAHDTNRWVELPGPEPPKPKSWVMTCSACGTPLGKDGCPKCDVDEGKGGKSEALEAINELAKHWRTS